MVSRCYAVILSPKRRQNVVSKAQLSLPRGRRMLPYASDQGIIVKAPLSKQMLSFPSSLNCSLKGGRALLVYEQSLERPMNRDG